MFQKARSIILLTKDKLYVCRVTLKNPAVVENLQEYEWRKTTLTNLLINIQQKFGSVFRLIVAEDFSYVTSISIPVTQKSERTFIAEMSQEQIPEPLDNTAWDFKEILLVQNSAEDPGVKIIQVVGLTHDFVDHLHHSMQESGVKFEAIEPLSCTFARAVRDEAEPVMLLYLSSPGLLLMVHRGLVVASERLAVSATSESLTPFLTFCKNKFNIAPKKLLIVGQNGNETNLPAIEIPGAITEGRSVNLFVAMAEKTDINGKDSQVLNIDINKYIPAVDANTDDVAVHAPDNLVLNNEDEETEPAPEADKKGPPIIIPDNSTQTIDTANMTLADIGTQTSHPDQTPAEPTVPSTAAAKPKKKKKIMPIIGFLILIIFVASIVFLIVKSGILAPKVVSPISTTKETTIQIPTPTPTATQAKTVYTIKILNGTKKEGEAGRLKTTLTDKGLSVGDIGNADEKNVTVTKVQIKSSVDEKYKKDLDKILKDLYTETNIEDLDENSTVDVIITIGASK